MNEDTYLSPHRPERRVLNKKSERVENTNDRPPQAASATLGDGSSCCSGMTKHITGTTMPSFHASLAYFFRFDLFSVGHFSYTYLMHTVQRIAMCISPIMRISILAVLLKSVIEFWEPWSLQTKNDALRVGKMRCVSYGGREGSWFIQDC